MQKNFTKQLMRHKHKVSKWSTAIIKGDSYRKEQNTMIKFVVPLFEILGWSPLYKDMEFEYVVTDKNTDKKSRVDIALYTKDSGKPKTFVEVKPISGKLTTGSQLLRYLKNTDAEYGIYTNGKEIKLISKHRVRDGYAPRIFFHLKDINDFITYSDVLWLLSKPSLKKGKLDRLAELYHTDYWKWKKKYKNEHKRTDDYRLALIYAREKLKHLKR